MEAAHNLCLPPSGEITRPLAENERAGFLAVSAFYSGQPLMQLVYGCVHRYTYMRDLVIAEKLGMGEKQARPCANGSLRETKGPR